MKQTGEQRYREVKEKDTWIATPDLIKEMLEEMEKLEKESKNKETNNAEEENR